MKKHRMASGANSLGAIHREIVAKAWAKFLEFFPTKRKCLDEIYRRIGVATAHCPFCQSRQIRIQRGGRFLKCGQCKRSKWLTSGTFFERIKHPTLWLGSIWLFEQGLMPSAHQIHILSGVTYATCFSLFRKISFVLESHHVSEGKPEYPSSLFTELFRKRSRETPKRKHPADSEWTAEDENQRNSTEYEEFNGRHTREDQNSHNNREEQQTPDLTIATTSGLLNKQLDDQQKQIVEALSQTPLSPEILSARTSISIENMIPVLASLEISGIARCTGGKFVLAPKTQADTTYVFCGGLDVETAALLRKAVEFINEIYRGISQKYLQHYLARYWCMQDRARWAGTNVTAACSRFRRIRSREFHNLSSPPSVWVTTTSPDLLAS